MIQLWNFINSPLLKVNKWFKEDKDRGSLENQSPLSLYSLMCIKMWGFHLATRHNCRPLIFDLGKQRKKISNQSPLMIC